MGSLDAALPALLQLAVLVLAGIGALAALNAYARPARDAATARADMMHAAFTKVILVALTTKSHANQTPRRLAPASVLCAGEQLCAAGPRVSRQREVPTRLPLRSPCSPGAPHGR